MRFDRAMSSAVAPNFSIVTLGVTDLDRSIRFYADLGWEQRGDRAQGIVWFKTAATWIGLFGYDELAEDAALTPPPMDSQPRYRGITLAINLPTEDEVDEAFECAVEAGGSIVKAAARMTWGGYSGYFADPDGHLWEICYNPGFPIDADGRIEIG
jgi:catechol 2,3-dioxygenase-like lactoylglutathione lyase family enzyme